MSGTPQHMVTLDYLDIGPEVGVDLINSPELANDPRIAGAILAQFLFNHRAAIRQALSNSDMKAARKAVNGGDHGLAQFTAAFDKGIVVIPG